MVITKLRSVAFEIARSDWTRRTACTLSRITMVASLRRIEGIGCRSGDNGIRCADVTCVYTQGAQEYVCWSSDFLAQFVGLVGYGANGRPNCIGSGGWVNRNLQLIE